MDDKYFYKDIEQSLQSSWKDYIGDFAFAKNKNSEEINDSNSFAVNCMVLDFRLSIFQNKLTCLRNILSEKKTNELNELRTTSSVVEFNEHFNC